MAKFEFTMKNPCRGYAAENVRQGEDIRVCMMDFATSSDWDKFEILAGLVDEFLSKLPSDSSVDPSQTNHMLFVSHPDDRVQAYIDELKFISSAKLRGSIKKGDLIRKSDIAGIESLELVVDTSNAANVIDINDADMIDIPNDAGIIFVFSHRWRKAIFFDHTPLWPPHHKRQYDIKVQLGSLLGYTVFEERHRISSEIHAALHKKGWFPFIGLSEETLDMLIKWTKDPKFDPDEGEFVDIVVSDVQSRCDQMLAGWKNKPSFFIHLEDLVYGVEKFKEEEWRSCIQTLYLKIEGIIRSQGLHKLSSDPRSEDLITRNPRDKDLRKIAVQDEIEKPLSILLPHQFSEYLKEFYFRNFKSSETRAKLSRHSIAHGVSDPSEYNSKNAVIGLLILEQLFYLFAPDKSSEKQS